MKAQREPCAAMRLRINLAAPMTRSADRFELRRHLHGSRRRGAERFRLAQDEDRDDRQFRPSFEGGDRFVGIDRFPFRVASTALHADP
jgi:hypothetical protein